MNVDEIANWIILGIEDTNKDGKYETLLITTDNPIHANLSFYGAEAYNNGPEEINRICEELYSNSEYGKARGMTIEDVKVNIYDKERMLIELIRYKSKLPYELYKEVVNNYRKIKDELNFIRLYKYAQNFNNSYIMRTIEAEVM